MPGFFEAAEEVWGKEPEKKKIYTVNIQGKEIEVSLEKSLEIMKHGEEAYMLEGGKIVRRPIKKNNLRKSVLKKSDKGYKFYDNDPLWVESIVEEGFSWQIESE
jgi:hypothetical protein